MIKMRNKYIKNERSLHAALEKEGIEPKVITINRWTVLIWQLSQERGQELKPSYPIDIQRIEKD
jgi:hypothetical protein